MRVVFCVCGYSPDVERLQPWLTIHEVAAVLIASGWEVHLVTDVEMPPSLEGIRHHYVRTMRPSNSGQMHDLLDEIVPDRVVVLVTPLSLLFSGWYRFVRCKLFAFAAYPFYTRPELLRALKCLQRPDILTYGKYAFVPGVVWARTLGKYFSGVIAQSSRTVDRVAGRAGASVHAHALGAGVDLAFWKPADGDIPCRKFALRCLYVGSARKIRGFDVLLGAFSELACYDIELKILARGSTDAEVDEIRERIKCSAGAMYDRITVIGGWMDREQYREEIRAADVVTLPFVLVPSELPVSVIECIATGTPVIATNIDGLPDAVGAAGIIVRSGCVAELAGAISSLADSRDDLEVLREQCVKARNRMMCWSDVGLEWLQVLSV